LTAADHVAKGESAICRAGLLITNWGNAMKLYEFAPTRSIRVRWTLQELGVDFETITVDLLAGEHRSPAFLKINPAGKLPVLVAYAIPARDCGSYSSGGADSASAYRRWIRRFAAGIGRHPAVVILEPDALPELECLDANARQARLASLRDAVAVLSAKPGVGVYLDAGQSAWRSVPTMVARLRAAGVGRARGFSLNVASYWPTAAQIPYGNAIAVALGGKHYVVDTSRNGRGPLQRVWCNPPGRGLGDRPTTATASPFADAYFWIKRPGESDGSCNGGPSAGQWWPEYALGLARRAAY
jgi:endoglucanase